MANPVLSDLSRRGLAIYDERLRATLEPEQNGRYVAIHVPTGDYAVGSSSGEAMREMLKRRPADGQLVIRRIGPEPDYGMAARALAGDRKTESRAARGSAGERARHLAGAAELRLTR